MFLFNLGLLSEGSGRRGHQPSCRNRCEVFSLTLIYITKWVLDKKCSICELQNRVSRYVGKCMPIDYLSKWMKNALLLQFSAAGNKTQRQGGPSLWERTGGDATTPGGFFSFSDFHRSTVNILVFIFSFSTLFKIVKIRLTPRTGQVQGGRTSVYNGRYYYRNNVRRL